MLTRTLLALFLGTVLPGFSQAAETLIKQKPTPHSTVSLISEENAVVPGQTLTVGLLFRMEPKWHIYWKNPGDSGQPPRIQWHLPDGFTAGEIQWPGPKRLLAPGLTDYGYESQVLLTIPVQVPARLAAKSVDLHADLKYLICENTCIPAKTHLELTLPVSTASAPLTETAALFKTARESVPVTLPSDWQVAATEYKDGFRFDIKAPRSLSGISFIPLEAGQVDNAAPQQSSPAKSGATLTVKRSESLAGAVPQIAGLLVLSGGQQYVVASPVTAALQSNAPTSAPAAANAALGLGPWAAAVLLAFLGGMLLNVMPCVFPVLTLKLLAFVDVRPGEIAKLRRGSWVYTLGILASFWVLAGLLLTLRAAGRQVGWGFQLQSPDFVALLCVLLFLLGLALTGLFEVGSSLMGVGSELASRQGYAGSFFTGVLATVVATPCTAPFMGTALGVALTQPAIISLSVFTALALGLAFPLLLFSYIPAWAKLLPKPGAWMEKFKQFSAFPLYGAVIWLVWVFARETSIDAGTRLLVLLLVTAFSAWLFRTISNRRAAALVAAVILLCGAFWFRSGDFSVAASSDSAASDKGANHWESFSPQKVEEYRNQGKTVFVDFTAAWCITCQVNERLVLNSQAVKAKLKQRGIVLMKADWTSYDAGITQTLDSLGKSGVPLYVLYFGNRPARLLPEGVLTEKAVIEALDHG